MSESTDRVDTNSSSSSSLSNPASVQQNLNLVDLAGQLASFLNLGKLSETLTNLTDKIAYLDRKVDQKFGDLEKPLLYSNDLKTIDNKNPTSISSFTSFPGRNKFPELISKDSKNLREKVGDEILKDYKVWNSSSPFVGDVVELSSSSSSTRSSSSPLKISSCPILSDTAKKSLVN
jgi:hypothetical protein